MVFGACATHFINLCSTLQCAIHIVTGARTKFVDRYQKIMFITITEKLVHRVLSAD